MGIKNWLIRTLGLKGSWSWAKVQMMQGKIVTCKHWSGELKLKIDSPNNQLLQCSFYGIAYLGDIKNAKWETSNHFLTYEGYTDYEVVNSNW